MLDQIALAGSIVSNIGQRLPHHIELVIARPYLRAFLPAAARVFFLDDLRIVLKDVGQSRRREDFFP